MPAPKMTTITTPDIKICPTEVQVADRNSESSGSLKAAVAVPGNLLIVQYDPSFSNITGSSPTHSLLASTASANTFFHESCIYLPDHDELYTTSGLLQSVSSSYSPTILISRIKLHRSSSDENSNHVQETVWAKMRPPTGIDMPNGGTNYRDGILFCSQGNLTPGSGGIHYMPRSSKPTPLVTNFHGRDFNSVGDVVVAKDGSFWFTDPSYGHEQEFRPKPQLPCCVYRFVPETGEIRVVADGFVKPNGIAFSPAESTLYVSDTGGLGGNGVKDFSKPATIYAFEVNRTSGSPFLMNRRVFAMAAMGFPDRIKCDAYGNVYAGCGDGVEVWNMEGTIIGKILVGGGAASFSFGKDGEMFICNDQRLWRVQLDKHIIGGRAMDEAALIPTKS